MGNAGMITPSHFVPLAQSGMVSQGIRWMFDAKSPFFIRPRASLEMVDWGLKFWQSSTQKHVDRSARPLVELSLLSKNLFQNLLKSPDFDCCFEKNGIVLYFKKEKTGEEEVHLAEKARALGLETVVLDREECRALEPDLKPDVLGGVHYRDDAHLHPQTFIRQLRAVLEKRGVQFFFNKKMTAVERKGRAVTAIFCEKEKFEADAFVLATGSWSPETGSAFGLKIPVLPGKGYSVTLENPEKTLRFPAILAEARVAMTPMCNRLRIGGTMEIDRVDHEKRVSLDRVRGILAGTMSFFPDLKLELPPVEKIWHGLRPVSPDGLPYIGAADGFDNLFIGTGHAMLGLSLGPGTGFLLANLMNGEAAGMDLGVFRTGRFYV